MTRSSNRHPNTTLGIIAVVLLLAGVILLSVNIKTITVTGNNRYSDQEITDMLFSRTADWNSVYCYIKDHTQEHQQIPFVEDYKLVFQGPSELEIIVYEKSVVGYVSYMGSYMYFDKDGIIVESTNEKLEDIPWITGLQFGQIVLHKPLPVDNQKIFEEILNLTQVLSVHQIQVDKIRFAGGGEISLYLGEIEVVLGDSSNVNGKIAELSDMMPQLAGLSGTLYLNTYDETNSSMMYTFKKKLRNY